MYPSSDSSHSLQLKHLSTQTCLHLQQFSTSFDQEFIDKIYCMVVSGATLSLKKANRALYVIEVTGIRVVTENVAGKKKFNATADPSSIARIEVLDCGYKFHVSAVIGNQNFASGRWATRLNGNIARNDQVLVIRQLSELAYSIYIEHRQLLIEKLRHQSQ